jgi:CheY-like chemotaxis protein
VYVLAKLERQPYDIIFMDVEMPEMDGLEATRRIVELKPGRERPIIVGTTAYGLAGDEHECLDAGMHDCINKPIRIEQIQDCLLRWGEPWASEAGKQRTSHPEAIDQERIAELEEMERRAKKNLIQELVTVYLEDLPVMLAAVQNGLASGDVAAAGKAAHRLKGTSLNVGANALADVCRIIESKARAGDSKGLPELLPDLEQQVRDAGEALRALLARRR